MKREVYRMSNHNDKGKAFQMFGDKGVNNIRFAWDIMCAKDSFNNTNNIHNKNIDAYILVEDGYVIDASSFQIYQDEIECFDISDVYEKWKISKEVPMPEFLDNVK